MAEKSFGVKEINLIGASGTPTIESPNNLNLNAVNVAISTNATIGGNLTVSGTVGIAGTLTYEDVTNIDAIGIITARNGVNLTGGNLSLGDSGGSSDDRISIGAGGDINIYHNGTDSYVSNATGDLRLFSVGGSADDVLIRAQDDIELQPNNGQSGVKVIGTGAVELYHNNSKKLETSSSGAIVTGTLAATAVTGDGSGLTGIAVTEAPVTDYTISANGSSAYRIHGGGVDETANSPDLYLIRGQKYRFNNTTGSSHPFAIRVSDGGSAYTDGVSGDDEGVQLFTVPYDAPAKIFYQCTIHGGMVGNIYIRGANGQNDNVGVTTFSTFLQVLGQAGTSDKGLEVRANSTQNTDTNKAIRVRNNSTTDTFNLSYKGQGYFAGKVAIGTDSTSGANGLTVYKDDTSLGNTVLIEQDGTGDAVLGFAIKGTAAWQFGIDNSDSDKFKISYDGSGLASSTAVTLDRTGKIGIGTDNPSYTLDVRADNFTKAVFQGTGSNSSNIPFYIMSGGSACQIGNHPSGQEETIIFNSTNNFISFETADTERLRIHSDGKIGIGTDNPDTEFHVYDGNSLLVSLFESETHDSRLRIKAPSTKYSQIEFADDDADTGEIRYDHTDDSMQFFVNSNTERLRIDSSGRMGLGVTPTGIFDIRQNNNPQLTLRSASHADNGGGRLNFAVGVSAAPQDGNTMCSIASTIHSTSGGSLKGDMKFYTNGGDDLEERLRIKSDGKVGIGTDNPQKLLELQHSTNRKLQFSFDDNIITMKGANNNGNPETIRLIGGNSIRFHTGATGSGDERLRITDGGQVVQYTNHTSGTSAHQNTGWYGDDPDHYTLEYKDFNEIRAIKTYDVSDYSSIVYKREAMTEYCDIEFTLKGNSPTGTYRHVGFYINGDGSDTAANMDRLVFRNRPSNTNSNQIRLDKGGGGSGFNITSSTVPNFFDGNERHIHIQIRKRTFSITVNRQGHSEYNLSTRTDADLVASRGYFGFNIFEQSSQGNPEITIRDFKITNYTQNAVPTTSVAFQATISTGNPGKSSGYTTKPANQEFFDNGYGGNYNTSNYRFTAPVAGIYQFSNTFNCYASPSDMFCSIRLNGSTQYIGNKRNNNTGNGDQNVTAYAIIQMEEGDYVDARDNTSNGVTYSSGIEWNRFEGSLIAAYK